MAEMLILRLINSRQSSVTICEIYNDTVIVVKQITVSNKRPQNARKVTMSNEIVQITSEVGLLAKKWVLGYYTQAVDDNPLPPEEYFLRRLGMADLPSDYVVGQVKIRYWMYLSMIQLGLNDELYLGIQQQLMEEFYNQTRIETQPRIYRFTHDGDNFAFSLYPDKLILHCSNDFDFGVYWALCAKLDVIFGDKNTSLRLRDIADDQLEFELIRNKRSLGIESKKN